MEIKGIDVSREQGTIDWETVADYGMGFAILRITEKGNKTDSKFAVNYRGCKQHGIPIGVYKYSYALSAGEAIKEAEKVLAVLDGRELNFPAFYDLEWAEQRKLGKAAVEKIALAFLDTIQSAGYKVGIYCNADWYGSVLTDTLKKYDCWIARYPAIDNGSLQERLRPSYGVGWQYSSKATIPGIRGVVDRNVFYKDYRDAEKEENTGMTKEQIIKNVIDDAVDFAVRMANDNKHGYSQRVRSLYNITNPTSFDCSSLACTAYYYAFLKNGLKKQAEYLKAHCSYTGNMLNMLNCGFEVVARNQTAHAQMVKGDLELNTTHHVAMAVDKNTIVHARSSEGTSDTKDNSGNEIRTQPWYLYSRGWTHRLRFTGKGVDFSDAESSSGGTTTKWKATGTATATVDNLYVRAEPNGEVIGELMKGNRFEIDGSVSGKWSHVKVTGIGVGWVWTAYTQKDGAQAVDPPKQQIANKQDKTQRLFVGKVTAGVLNVRTWAGTEFPQIRSYPQLTKGNLVDVMNFTQKAKDGTSWYYVRIAEKYYGFVSAAYIERQ